MRLSKRAQEENPEYNIAGEQYSFHEQVDVMADEADYLADVLREYMNKPIPPEVQAKMRKSIKQVLGLSKIVDESSERVLSGWGTR